jgi:sec-independent protein translocase protein TatA
MISYRLIKIALRGTDDPLLWPGSGDRPEAQTKGSRPRWIHRDRSQEKIGMPQLGVWELLAVLVIVLLIFGATRIKDIGKGLGSGIAAFRSEVKADQEDKDETS